MQVGAVENPTQWDRWPEAEALLEPARARGDFASCLDPDEALYVVLDGDELLACATAWMGIVDGEQIVEVKLVGGHDRHRWLAELDNVIGAAARGAKATRLVAIGRRGWLRELKRLGWERIGEVEDQTIYARKL